MRRQEKKQYLTVGGKPVLAHTLEALGRIGPLTSIIVVVGEEDLERVRDYPRAYPGVPQPLQVVAGGAERQQSVYAGLLALEHTGVEYVLVHDGVRPFLRKEAVEACMEQAERSGAAVLAVPVKDTIKRVDERGSSYRRRTATACERYRRRKLFVFLCFWKRTVPQRRADT